MSCRSPSRASLVERIVTSSFQLTHPRPPHREMCVSKKSVRLQIESRHPLLLFEMGVTNEREIEEVVVCFMPQGTHSIIHKYTRPESDCGTLTNGTTPRPNPSALRPRICRMHSMTRTPHLWYSIESNQLGPGIFSCQTRIDGIAFYGFSV